MIRPLSLLAVMMALVPPVRAEEPDLSGNWLLSLARGRGPERALQIVRVEMKDGKPVVSTVFPTGARVKTASGLEIQNGTLRFAVDKDVFEGRIAPNGTVVGNWAGDGFAYRAKLTRTEKKELAPADLVIRVEEPPLVTEVEKLMTAFNGLRLQIARERDAEKKKELNEKLDIARKDLDEKLKEVIAKHTDTVFALDAAMDLFRNVGKTKLAAPEVKKLLAAIEKQAEPYGRRYADQVALTILELPEVQKEHGALLTPMAEKVYKGIREDASLEHKANVLSAYRAVLEASRADPARLKAISAELAKVETKLDLDYAKKVPPFKPAAFAGRKDKSANQVVVMELFTGAQCPPCVAADVAFDALEKSYKPTELVMIQYHLHIPGPDPLTNPDTVARAAYYGARSTPSTLFNGKSLAGGGGAMANAERKFTQYADIIDPLLEKSSDVKVAGRAYRTGDKVGMTIEVAGAEGDEMKLRLLVVEEAIRYTGGNGLRFHHQVVRVMPGSPEGAAINNKAFKLETNVDLNTVRKNLTAYLDDYANSRPFPKLDRPMDMKNLRVIALVQNDKTKEIVQAIQLDVEGRSAAGSGE